MLIYILQNGKFQLLPVKLIGDIITTSVLPGFTLNLTDLFNNIEPDE